MLENTSMTGTRREVLVSAVATPDEMPTSRMSSADVGAKDRSSEERKPSEPSSWFRILFWSGLFIGALLLLLFPLAKPLWTDEVLNLECGYYPLIEIARGNASPRDHTPLQALVLWGIRNLFGDSIALYRFFSALPGVFTPYIAYLLGRRLNYKVGLLALWITAISPGILLFDRMTRYHAVLGLLATWSVYLFLRALGTGKSRLIVAYGVVTMTMLLIYVPSLFLVVGQFLALAYQWRSERHAPKVFGAMVACAVLLSPVILWQLAGQSGGGGGVSVEDPSVGQGLGGFIRRFMLPVYMYCVGETVYPWTWAVSLPGVVGSLFAFVAGAAYLHRKRECVIPIVVVVTTLLFALITSGRFGAMQTLGSMGKRDSFLVPLFCVTVATGLMMLRPRPIRVGMIIVLFCVWIYSDVNYWIGREFLNPNYTAPWGAVMSRLEADGFREKAVIITEEAVIDFGLRHSNSGVPVVNPNKQSSDADGVSRTISLSLNNLGRRRYLYFIGRDRGDHNAVVRGATLCTVLGQRFGPPVETGFMWRTDAERLWLSEMMHRPTLPYYIWVKRFDTQSPRAVVALPSRSPKGNR